VQSTEAEGRTIDEAIARAVAALGVPRERVEIEILANATRGLFGFGGKPARVRATLRAPMMAVADSPPAPAPPRSAPAPAEAPPKRHAVAPRPERPRREAEPRRRQRPRRHEAPRPEARRRPAAPEVPLSPEALERARALLAEIVRLCGVDGSVAAVEQTLVIHGDTSGLLIGRRGQTLDALEYVVNRAVGHDEERAAHVAVDANGYRARRRAALEALAHRMAEEARSKGRPVSLNPMSPRERRIVHLALQDDPALTTRSAGSGFYRRLVIAPTASRRE
jgi:spoIIIJ-associated protein